MEFLFKHDFQRQAEPGLLQDLTGGDNAALGLAVTAALAEARGHLATTRHDLPAIFAQITAWAPGAVAAGAVRQHVPDTWTAAVHPSGAVVVDGTNMTWVAAAGATAMDVPGVDPAWAATGVLSTAVWVAMVPTSSEPGSGAAWSQSDPRHPLMVMRLVDIALYHLSSRVDPRGVPEIRMQRHEDAVKWLRDIAAGKITDPNLPLVTEPENTSFSVFSQPARDFNW